MVQGVRLTQDGLVEVPEFPAAWEYLFRTFSPMGWLSKKIPNYKMRDGQLRLAYRVHKALTNGEDLIAEGPVGLGKSFAYCVPLSWHIAAETTSPRPSGLIITANIALQEQLINKDLPLMKEALPWDIDYHLIKGRNNYLCKNALKDLYEKGLDGVTRLQMYDAKHHTDHYKRVAVWAQTTATGDRSELSFEPSVEVWSKFSVTSEECLGSRCPDHVSCFANKARDSFHEAWSTTGGIFVTNYHLFFGSFQERLATFTSSSGQTTTWAHASSLPNFSYVVMDEVHKAADIARDFFGFKITQNSFRWVAKHINNKPGLRRGLEESSFRLFHMLEDLGKKHPGRFRSGVHPQHYAEVLQKIDETVAYFNDKISWADGLLSKEAKPETIRNLQHMRDVDGHSLEVTKRLRHRLTSAMSNKDSRSYVYSVEMDRGRPTLVARRINAFSSDGHTSFSTRSRVLISATITTGGEFGPVTEDFRMAAPEFGLNPAARTFVAESPFHWPSQAKLIIPEEFPNPRDKAQFQQQVALAIGYVITQAKGRTMALFTTWEGLESAYAALKGKFPYRLLKQGELPRTQLLEEFKRDVSSVLFGVESFWSGVDIPGEALSCLVIDKLPFPNPNDPVMEALEELMSGSPFEGDKYQESAAFEQHSIPRMILTMRQGFGRLIRTVQDRGVVVLLDKRVHTKWNTYGKLLINSLPPVSQSVDLDDVRRFLDR